MPTRIRSIGDSRAKGGEMLLIRTFIFYKAVWTLTLPETECKDSVAVFTIFGGRWCGVQVRRHEIQTCRRWWHIRLRSNKHTRSEPVPTLRSRLKSLALVTDISVVNFVIRRCCQYPPCFIGEPHPSTPPKYSVSSKFQRWLAVSKTNARHTHSKVITCTVKPKARNTGNLAKFVSREEGCIYTQSHLIFNPTTHQ